MVATTVAIDVNARWKGDSVNRGTKQVNRDMDRLKSTLQRMAPILRTIGALMGVAVGVQAVRQIVGMADAWKGFENRIKLFTKTSKEVEEVTQRLFTISMKTRTSMKSTVELYQRFSMANKELGLSQSELAGVLETVNQALIISGGSSESANAAVVQLGQGLASGTLRGEELNSVLEQAPRLAQAIAAGLGVPIGKLRELGAEGKITSVQIIEALQDQQSILASEYGKMESTVAGAWTNITNAVGLYITEFDKAVSGTTMLATAMNLVAQQVAGAAQQESVAPGNEEPEVVRRREIILSAVGVGGGGDTGPFRRTEYEEMLRQFEDARGTDQLGPRADLQSPAEQMRASIEATGGTLKVGAETIETLQRLIDDAKVERSKLSLKERQEKDIPFFERPWDEATQGPRPVLGRIPEPTAARNLSDADIATLREDVRHLGQRGVDLRVVESASAAAATLAVKGLGPVGAEGARFGMRPEEPGPWTPTNRAGLFGLAAQPPGFVPSATSQLMGQGVGLGGIGGGDITAGRLDIGAQAANLALMQRAQEAQATTERELLVVRQKFEKANTKLTEDGEVYLGKLTDVHEAELQRFDDEANKKTQDTANRALDRRERDMDRDTERKSKQELRDEQRRLNAVIGGSINMLGTVNPMLAGFGNAIANLANNVDPAVVSMDLLQMGVSYFAAQAQKAANDLAKAKQALVTADRKAGPVAKSLVKSLEPEVYQASLDRVNEQINAWFEGLQESGLGIAGSVDRMFSQIEVLEAAGKSLEGNQFRRNLGLFTEGFADQDTFVADLMNLGMSIQDAVSEVLTVEGAFNTMGDAAAAAAAALKPLQRAVTTTFDVEEMKLRRSASAQFGAAGGDIHEQARVFAQLRTSIDDLAVREEAAFRALSATPGAGTGAGAGAAPVDPAPVSGADAVVLESAPLADFGVDSYDDIIDFTGSITKIEKSWADAVGFTPSNVVDFGVSHWGGVVDMAGLRGNNEEVQYRISWSEAVTMTTSTAASFNAHHWGGVIDMARLRGRRRGVQYHIPWSEAVTMTQKIMLDDWSDIFTGSIVSRGKAPMMFTGSAGREPIENTDAVHLNPTLLDDWSDLFTGSIVSRGKEPMMFTGGVIGGPSGTQDSDAYRINRLMLDDWTDLFTGSIVSGGINPMTFYGQHGGADNPEFGTGTQAYQLHRLVLNDWSDIFGGPIISGGMEPMHIDINDIIRVVGSPRKLSVADIVDLSELEGIVGGIVARASRNRSTGDTREEARSRTRQSGKEGADYYKNTGSGMGW